VRFFVRHFKGRIPYYTIWGEQDACGPDSVKCIMPEDYVELVRQVIPVIREEDPEAKIVSGPNVLFFDRDDLFTLLRSDVVKQFDVISWHGLYDVAPNIEFYGNYYYEYPSIVQEIKRTASAHGFQGVYWGTEITWCSEEFPWCHPADQPWGQQKTDLLAAKYLARWIVWHHGMDVGVSVGGYQPDSPWSYPTIRNLNTVMAGNKPIDLAVEIESDATNIMSFGFSLPNGDRLFAMWTDGVAVDDDPGIPATLTFPGTSAQKVIGIDVLHGFERELIIEMVDGHLVIRDCWSRITRSSCVWLLILTLLLSCSSKSKPRESQMENSIKTNRLAIVIFVSGLISLLSFGITLIPLLFPASLGNFPEPGSPINRFLDVSRSVGDLATIVSLVTGILALREIRKKGAMEKGKTLAWVGMALGAGWRVLIAVYFILGMLFSLR
jgi:hypothetical protein